MAEMTAIERVDKHVRLEASDRVGIAPMGEFYYAALAGMTVADVLMDPRKADEAFEFGFKKHVGFDMSEVGFLLAMYMSPVTDIFSTFYFAIGISRAASGGRNKSRMSTSGPGKIPS